MVWSSDPPTNQAPGVVWSTDTPTTQPVSTANSGSDARSSSSCSFDHGDTLAGELPADYARAQPPNSAITSLLDRCCPATLLPGRYRPAWSPGPPIKQSAWSPDPPTKHSLGQRFPCIRSQKNFRRHSSVWPQDPPIKQQAWPKDPPINQIVQTCTPTSYARKPLNPHN